jgi:hypothetical protein
MERLAEDVRRELGRFGPQAEITRIAELWAAAVGEQIARNAWPARVSRDGTLHVNTSSSTWAFELAQLEREIRGRLGAHATPRLRFAPGPLPEPPTRPVEPAVAAQSAPSAVERRAAGESAASIADEKLRKLIARAVAAGLAKARSSRSV